MEQSDGDALITVVLLEKCNNNAMCDKKDC